MMIDETLAVALSITSRYVNLKEEELLLFSSLLEKINLNKGDILINQGEIAKSTYWVKIGLLRQYYYKDGRDITEHFASEGQGMMCIKSLFNNEPSSLIIEALEQSVVYLSPYQKLIELSEKYPVFHTYHRKLLEEILIVSQKKADSWRFETVRQRYDHFMTEFSQAAKRASINHIASYLLMTPESLSRVRSGKL
ncbi:MAG: Crp/Fnr family transcriptional regulator [Bacteroidales bacterium]|jgi:CRP-like cAMP-binding protein|nr:Crp/Fnr family transcriptional regulator [Bacteroidales bacterium]